MKQRYIQECTNCGNVVVGREKRGFIRDALHGGPGTAVEFIPVGGKLIWKASKEIVLRLLRTDMEKWGDELEKWIYKDIQVEYECPKCGKTWTETHPLSESDYKQMIADYVSKVKDLATLNKSETKKQNIGKSMMVVSRQESIGMNMKLQIPYKELEAFLMKKYDQEVKLGFVDEKTMSVTKKVVIKDATVNISVDQVTGNDIMLHYQAGFGIEWIIKGALMWFKETISGFVDEQDENKLLIHLDRIEQLNNMLEKIEIKAVSFDDLNVNVAFIAK
ncbi:hypothetical protein [Pseudobutyrivibrio sp.]|jgi:predicted RNA-binding Zn-ribbon protein involved in translation (DUF1610 family)|uniref:hypothetical protein n=1 Tax=Pseudobutyrivibrio sp. TaxID=2014367 RepID=UPI0025EC7CE4|nr:hypothetical protein [Pseudobutyrivibrio sp.]